MTSSNTVDLVITTINAGTSDPSSTAMLADRVAAKTSETLTASGTSVALRTIHLKPLAVDIANALTTGLLSKELEKAVELINASDAVIGATPVYKAGASALFTGFFQILDNDLFIGKPVLLTATAGTDRHALVIDGEMRSLFAYLRALVTPSGVFATPDDFSSNELGERIERVAAELSLLVKSNFAKDLREEAWGGYQHNYGSAGGTEFGIDFDSDLMRLATGG